MLILIQQTDCPATENTGAIVLGPLQVHTLLMHNINAPQILVIGIIIQPATYPITKSEFETNEMSSTNEFVFNVAFTVSVNDQPEGPMLTLEEFWRGLERGGERPHLFAEYVAGTEILPNRKSKNEFQRKLIMADGAVHTAKNVELIQDVRNAENLLVSHAPALGEYVNRSRALRVATWNRLKPSRLVRGHGAQCLSPAEATRRTARRCCI
jgi:hypothetical protein